MRLVKVQDLAVGQRIARDVVNSLGKVVLPAGTVMKQCFHTIMKAFSITEVAIEDDSSDITATKSETSATVGSVQCMLGSNDPKHPLIAELVAIRERVLKKEPGEGALTTVAMNTNGSTSQGERPKERNWLAISPETIVTRAGNLASLPTAYLQVDKVIKHPASSAADIAAVLSSDPGLISRLLRVGNSAFYGFPRRVEGIDEAVRIIGTRQLNDLVLATIVLSQFKNVDAHLVDMPSFWIHSLACGIASRSLAKLLHESNTERFFVGGLLHDIGSLVLYQYLPDRAQAALERHRQTDAPLEDAERAIVGCDHGAIGASLMTAWTLPPFYRDAAAYHHSSGRRPHTLGTAIIHLADLIVLSLELGSNGEVRLPRLSTDAWDLVGLQVDCLASIADEVISTIEETRRTFLGQEVAA